jgi:hypothetical protein
MCSAKPERGKPDRSDFLAHVTAGYFITASVWYQAVRVQDLRACSVRGLAMGRGETGG